MEYAKTIGVGRPALPGQLVAGARRAERSPRRDRLSVGIAAAAGAMFLMIAAARLLWIDSAEPIMFMQVVPVALIATRFGSVPGLLAGALAFGLWCGAEAIEPAGYLDLPSLLMRLTGFLGLPLAIGWLADADRASLARLAQSERDFRFIAEESVDVISTHAPDGEYRFVSNSARDLLGYRPGELIGMSSYVLFHPDDLPTVEGSHFQTLVGVDVVRTTYRLRHADGHYVWVETKSKTNRATDGQVQSIQCITRSASEDDTVREIARRQETSTRERIDRLISSGGPSMVFQPILDLGQARVSGVEALSRFPVENGPPPDVWFEEAWRVGRGLDLELLAIERAVTALDLLPPEWVLTVNASPLTVESPRLLDLLGGCGTRVIVELTEHAGVTDLPRFAAAITQLKASGIRLAIDDVGAGFAGLSRLLDLDPDIIKLDVGITRHIDSDLRRQALTSAFVAFAEEAGIMLVAEGVETEAEELALRERGVTLAQGYRFSRPVELNALISGHPVGEPALIEARRPA